MAKSRQLFLRKGSIIERVPLNTPLKINNQTDFVSVLCFRHRFHFLNKIVEPAYFCFQFLNGKTTTQSNSVFSSWLYNLPSSVLIIYSTAGFVISPEYILRIYCYNGIKIMRGIKPFKSVNPMKWSNTLKQFVSKLATNCLSVFDHFVGLAFKELIFVKIKRLNAIIEMLPSLHSKLIIGKSEECKKFVQI